MGALSCADHQFWSGMPPGISCTTLVSVSACGRTTPFSSYHRHIVAIQENLGKLRLSARVVAAQRSVHEACFRGSQMRVVLFRHVFKHHICVPDRQYRVGQTHRNIGHILTKSSKPSRVPLNSVRCKCLPTLLQTRLSSPLSPFMITHIGEPTHLSMSSSGSSCEDILGELRYDGVESSPYCT